MIIDQLVLYFNILRTNMAALEYSRVSGLVVFVGNWGTWMETD